MSVWVMKHINQSASVARGSESHKELTGFVSQIFPAICVQGDSCPPLSLSYPLNPLITIQPGNVCGPVHKGGVPQTAGGQGGMWPAFSWTSIHRHGLQCGPLQTWSIRSPPRGTSKCWAESHPEHELQPLLPPGFLTSHQEGGNFSSSLHTAGCSLLLLTLLLLSLCLEQTPLFA